ncbi:MAG: hypothetical protein ACYTDU_04705 [Planctomycetota bacterium]|jgi:hypothetical protein
MKAVPILVVTNALALGLVVLLFVRQSDLESQLNSTRTPTVRRAEVIEEGGVQDRIAHLERLMRARSGEGGAVGLAPAETAVGEELPTGAGGPAPGDDAAPAAAGEADAEYGSYDPQEMNRFRKKVRRANELNSEEDQVNRVVDRIDGLVSENKIAPLTKKQKGNVARTILSTRRKVPGVFRRLRESGALNDVPREERRQIIRAEFENLRVEAQKELENTVPAADAKTILDDSLGDRGMWRGMGGDGGGPGRSTSRSTSRPAGR